MKRGPALVLTVAVVLGFLSGWGVGRVHGDCEHSCPAGGLCPTPPDCLNHPFNWTGAVVLGVLVTLVVVALGLVALNRARRG